MSPLRQIVLACAVSALVFGCSDSSQYPPPPLPYGLPTEQEAIEATELEDAKAETSVSVEGMDLYMHELASDGSRRNPRLWVHAAEGTLNPDQSWSLVNPQATVYRETEEDIFLTSDAGNFDNSRRIAQLTGNVRVAAGTLNLETEEFEWHDRRQVARTDGGVTVVDGNSELTANRVILRPEDGSIEMRTVSGRLTLGGLEQ